MTRKKSLQHKTTKEQFQKNSNQLINKTQQ